MSKHLFFLYLICLFAIFYFIFSIKTSAQTATSTSTMKSEDYMIRMPNFNFASGSVTSDEYKLGFTGGENAIGLSESDGYRLRAGFWYIKSIIPFGFSLTPTSINFGTLTAGTPVTDNIVLTVSSGGAGGYRVTVQENKPLTSGSGNTIPDTTCDNGDCTESSATTWNQSSTYGFGYTLFGNDVPTPFPTGSPAGNLFKQFSDRTLNETPETVMVSSPVGKNRSSTMTLKVNVSGTQAAGSYQNILTFIATPGF